MNHLVINCPQKLSRQKRCTAELLLFFFQVKENREDRLVLKIMSEPSAEMRVIAYKVEYKKNYDDWVNATIREFSYEPGMPGSFFSF